VDVAKRLIAERGYAAVVCASALLTVAGCQRESPAPAPAPAPAAQAPAPTPAPAKPPAEYPRPEPAPVPSEPGRLPEDPEAGKRSSEQWDEHLREEERGRQLGYDRKRMKQHRAVVRLIAGARAQYERAKTEAAVDKVRKAMPQRTAQLRKQVTAIDHWGNNSPLLPDYEALAVALEQAYPDAKLAALKGDPQALATVRADFDRRMKDIDHWLEQAADSKDEY
jgi:hypothetical protein